MHLETLLYMLLQSDKTLPPTAVTPNFEGDAKTAEAARVPNQWFQIPEQTLTIGLDDPEDDSTPDKHFGWYCGYHSVRHSADTLNRDNEKPPRQVTVPAFRAKARPITNEEVC